MELEDFLAEYPRVENTPDFQGMFTQKYEFAELAGDKFEHSPKSVGETFFRHQKMFMRTLTHYDDNWKIDEAGTGKTGCLAAIAQYLKHNSDHIKRCIIICEKDQIEQIRQEIAMKYSEGEYIRESAREAETERGKQTSISAAMSEFYKFYTYGQFRKMIEETYPRGVTYDIESKSWILDRKICDDSNRRIIEDLSGTLFACDEFHFYRIEDNKDRFFFDSSGVKKPKRKILTYLCIWRVFHLIVRAKRLIFTATPVTNIATELNYHLNIFYPLHKQLWTPLMEEIALISGLEVTGWQEPPDWITRRDTDTMLADYTNHLAHNMRDKFTFVAANRSMAQPSYVPIVQPVDILPENSYLAIEIRNAIKYANEIRCRNGGKYDPQERARFVEMKGIQRRTYLDFVMTQALREVGIDEDEPLQDPAHYNARSICAGVFPDGTYGTGKKTGDGMAAWTIEENGNYRINPNKKASVAVKDENGNVTMRDMDLNYWFAYHLDVLSAKAYRIVQAAMYIPRKTYIASTYVEAGGAQYIGLALEAAVYRDLRNGNVMHLMKSKKFTRYRGGSSTFSKIDSRDIDRSKMTINLPPAHRYAIIYGKISKEEKKDIYDLYNHPSNANGEYLKVIIISRVGQTGISLQETMCVDFLDVPWNPGSEYQTKNRAIRALSHTYHQQELFTQAMFDPHISTTVKVEVNMLITVVRDDDGREIPTNDLQIYLRMVDRGRRNAIPVRAMKIVAIDSRLQKNRNTLDPSLDGTPESDYSSHEIPSLGWNGENYYFLNRRDIFPLSYDMTTYDVYYNESIVSRIQKIIINEFRTKGIIHVDDVLKKNSWIGKKKYIIMTLSKMMDRGDTVVDSFGYVCYIREEMGNFFITRTESRSDPFSDFTTTYYNTNIIGVHYNSFKNVVFDRAFGDAFKYLKSLETSTDVRTDLKNILVKASVIEKIGMLEIAIREYRSVIQDYVNQHTEKGSNFIVPNDIPGAFFSIYYNVNLFAWNEPKDYIERVTALIKGNHLNRVKEYKAEDINLMRNLSLTSPILIHNLYSLLPQKTRSGATMRLQEAIYKKRIFLFSEGYWRDPSEYEEPAYRYFLRETSKANIENYKKRFPRYFGIHDMVGSFKILDLEHESKNAQFGNKRSQSKSENYLSIDESELLYYCWSLGVQIHDPYIDSTSMLEKRQSIIKFRAPNLFRETWTFYPGKSNSVPDKFVEYCYSHYGKRRYQQANADTKHGLAIDILKIFIKTDRIYSQSLDLNDLLQHLIERYHNKGKVTRKKKKDTEGKRSRGFNM